jgi:hypothetical protein
MKGWKTYAVMAIGVIYNGLVASGIIDDSSREVVNAILAFLGLGALRNAVPKA